MPLSHFPLLTPPYICVPVSVAALQVQCQLARQLLVYHETVLVGEFLEPIQLHRGIPPTPAHSLP